MFLEKKLNLIFTETNRDFIFNYTFVIFTYYFEDKHDMNHEMHHQQQSATNDEKI